MDSFVLTTAIIGGFVIGGFWGTISLVVGIVRKRVWMGILGLVICIGFGVLMTTVFYKPATLSIVPAGIMALLIFLLSRTKESNKF